MENNGNNPDPADMFNRMWSSFATDMAKAGLAFDASQPQPDAARAMRDTMLATMNQHAQSFLRSPEFLEGMRESLDKSMAARKQLNDFLAQAQHEFQSASREDTDQVMQAIASLESRITSGMDRLGEHVDRIAQRLDKLEAASAPPKSAKKKTTKKKAAKKTAKTKATRKARSTQ